jgi:spermidine synthase
VLVIGLGSGMTTGAIACHPEVQRIDSVEISRAVMEAATLFSAKNYDILNNSRVRHVRADGRNHLLLTTRTYDLIVSEPSDPWLAGVGSLFTHEFFELCRARLKPDGVLAIWMATYALSPDAFPRVVATLHDVLPYVTVWETSSENYCLIASARQSELPLGRLEQRFAHPWVRADLNRIGIRDIAALLGTFVADQDSLRERLPLGGFHTDDNAFLEFTSPAYAWAGGGDVTHSKEWLLGGLVSPFERMIRTDPSNQHHQAVVEQTRARQAAMRLRWETHVALRALEFSEATARMNEALELAPDSVRTVSTAVELNQLLRQWVEPGPDRRFPEWMLSGQNRLQRSLTPEMRGLCFDAIADSQLGLPGS